MFGQKRFWCSVVATGVVAFGGARVLRAQQPVDTPQSPAPATPASPAPATVPSTSSVPQSHMIRKMQRMNYFCEDDNKVIVRLRGSNARVIFNNRIYNMKQIEAASGTKYSDGIIVWWSTGEEGFLQNESKAEKNRMLAKNCQLQKSGSTAEPAVAAKETVSGTVTYLQRVAMPPEAEIVVQLQDVTSPNQGAKIVVEEKFAFGGRQVPVPFELKFDPAKIDTKHLYALTARIFTGSELRFMNSKSYRVLTQGHPAKANLVLVPVEPAKDPGQ